MLAIAVVVSTLFRSQIVRSEVPIAHVRPSRLAADLAQMQPDPSKAPETVVQHLRGLGLIPKDADLTWDDYRSIFIVTAESQDSVDAATALLKEFDVEPAHVVVRLRVQSPLDKFDATSTVEQPTNRSWTLDQPTIDTSVTVTSRINGDGTITVIVSVRESKVATSGGMPYNSPNLAMKVVPSKEFRVQVDPNGRISGTVGQQRTRGPEANEHGRVTPLDLTLKAGFGAIP